MNPTKGTEATIHHGPCCGEVTKFFWATSRTAQTVPMKNGMHAARKIKVGSRSSMRAFQQVRDLQDRVDVIGTGVVGVDHLFGLLAADRGLPAVAFEVVGNAGDGIGMGAQVDLSVHVAVLGVGQDAGRHELRKPDGPGVGAGDAGRVDLLALRVAQQRLQLAVAPLRAFLDAFVVMGA